MHTVVHFFPAISILIPLPPGDTLYSIAWRVGIDVDELISLNNLHSPYLIHKGDILRVTGEIKEKPNYSFQSEGIKKIDCNTKK